MSSLYFYIASIFKKDSITHRKRKKERKSKKINFDFDSVVVIPDKYGNTTTEDKVRLIDEIVTIKPPITHKQITQLRGEYLNN